LSKQFPIKSHRFLNISGAFSFLTIDLSWD
jgi:hypothetical protein